MLTLLKKELAGFFSSLTGYIVIIVFLTANGLFLWVFPGGNNVLDTGYADLGTLFFIAPWVFLFLVPAVTMRLFADEKRTGTIELLFTRPLSALEIIFAKYLAGVILVLLSLLPTLFYFFTVYHLGIPEVAANLPSPESSIDTGGTWGSYIGLFFLAAVYVSIGVFASSITDNQIIAFITAMVLSFLIYIGFEAVSSMQIWGNSGGFIDNLGINAHYKSISRGVIDTRDIIYFLAVSGIFIALTKFVLDKQK